MSVVEIVVGRQAIFDRSLEVVAYELLFRAHPEEEVARTGLAGNLMTASVLYSAINLGIDQLVGDKLMFCNADREILTGSVPLGLPPERTVVEVLESVALDDEVVDGCIRLLGMGYQLALDDFVWVEGAERVLELASIVKIDVLQHTEEALAELVTRCSEFNVRLLAEKIETSAQMKYCLGLGFDYFQGYFLERPRNVSGRTLSGSQLGADRIASSLLQREFEVAELNEILQTEPGLAYQLLRLAGIGSRHGLRRRVLTIKDALVMVGPVRVQTWLALLMLRRHNAPSEHHLSTALSRARMCELLIQRTRPNLGPVGYTAGLLSAFDLLLGVDATEVQSTLVLDDELREAAFGHTSYLACVIRDVIAFEADPTSPSPRRSGLSQLEMDSAAIAALSWAMNIVSSIEQAANEYSDAP
jgi:c-di-GMP-related signal transduction protein